MVEKENFRQVSFKNVFGYFLKSMRIIYSVL